MPVILCGGSSGLTGIKAHALLRSRLRGFPMVAALLTRHTIASLLSRQLCIMIYKITGPIFFTCQVSAPGSHTVRAVIQGAATGGTVRAITTANFRMSTHRPSQLCRSLYCNTPVITAACDLHPLPILLTDNMHNRHTMCCLLFGHLLCGPGKHRAGRMQQVRFNIFMVHYQ